MSTLDTQQSSFTVSSYPNCYLFLNWHYNPHESEDERAVVFRSLVATVKIHPALDASLEAKAVKFLKSAIPYRGESADAFLSKFASSSDNSSSDFIQSIVVLISSSKHAIATASMEFLSSLLHFNSTHFRLTFVKADLLPKLITTLNPLSLSFTKAVDIHTHLVKSLRQSVRISSPRGLAELEIEDLNEQRAVHETVLKQVVVPSEKYICHLCVNRFSIVDGGLSETFLELLAQILRICPYYQRTMDFVLHMPVVLTIPSCLTFIEDNCSIWSFLFDMNNAQREWNQTRGEQRQMWKTLHRQLRMKGIEDVIDAKLGNDKNASYGRSLVASSISLNNLLGMNLRKVSILISVVAAILTDTHHIVAFAQSMCRCCLATPGRAGDTGVPVEPAVDTAADEEWAVESEIQHAVACEPVGQSRKKRCSTSLFLMNNLTNWTLAIICVCGCTDIHSIFDSQPSPAHLRHPPTLSTICSVIIHRRHQQTVKDDHPTGTKQQLFKSNKECPEQNWTDAFPFSTDCDPFLKWNEDPLESQHERAILQPALDASLEAKAVKFLEAVAPKRPTNSMQSIVVLLSSANRVIIAATMKILKADMIPPIINALNPQTLSLSDCEHIHTYLILSIINSVYLSTPFGLGHLRIKDGNDKQAVHATVLQQVLVPSEKYIWHLCVNRESIVDGKQSEYFLNLLARLLEISPHYQPTMQFILHMPVFLTIPSCLTFFEADSSIWDFLSSMATTQQKWNQTWGETRQMWKTMDRVLRTEGIEDLLEEKLRNDRDGSFGGRIVADSIGWNNLLGMNILEHEYA
ncbi:hypothetical protein BLNAU_1029 [Blattamonas nauphoetae]|uniref:Uncharacterized protein n=1 Tax=Blattamonas nauphoetae TaxID=2049346 RepID=A0ABQ9YJL5_9EUKA|nr:hypothetical protein BLNAU_1029 [Blattamonas nauphoetae]